jgi:hypothetical protein
MKYSAAVFHMSSGTKIPADFVIKVNGMTDLNENGCTNGIEF